jgi:hypothetical protein
MHQLHEGITNRKNFGFRAKIPQIRMGVIQTKIVQPNGPIPEMHDPSS